MPTGYTAKLYDGEPQTFPEFVESCARAFLAEMKESDGPIPEEFVPHPWHRDRLAGAETRLMYFRSLTPDQATEEARRSLGLWQKDRDEQIARKRAAVERCMHMMAHVKSWDPPTSGHVALRDFMIAQLAITIDADGPSIYWDGMPSGVGEEWREAEIAKAERDIAYHTAEWAKDQENADRANSWVKELRDSLKVPA